MGSDTLFVRANEIVDFIHCEAPQATVEQDNAHHEVRIVFPETATSSGLTVKITTAVSKQRLTDIINGVAQSRIYAPNGILSLRTQHPSLLGWPSTASTAPSKRKVTPLHIMEHVRNGWHTVVSKIREIVQKIVTGVTQKKNPDMLSSPNEIKEFIHAAFPDPEVVRCFYRYKRQKVCVELKSTNRQRRPRIEMATAVSKQALLDAIDAVRSDRMLAADASARIRTGKSLSGVWKLRLAHKIEKLRTEFRPKVRAIACKIFPWAFDTRRLSLQEAIDFVNSNYAILKASWERDHGVIGFPQKPDGMSGIVIGEGLTKTYLRSAIDGAMRTFGYYDDIFLSKPAEIIKFVYAEFLHVAVEQDDDHHEVHITIPQTSSSCEGTLRITAAVSRPKLREALDKLQAGTLTVSEASEFLRTTKPLSGWPSKYRIIRTLDRWCQTLLAQIAKIAEKILLRVTRPWRREGDDWSLFEKRTRSPHNIADARKTFNVPPEGPIDEIAVNRAYDIERDGHLFRLNRARARGMTLLVEMETEALQLIDIAYKTLMGYPRWTGVD
jgi:hypothetical protein